MVQARPKLQVAAKYALVELTPPKVSDIPAITSGKFQSNHSKFDCPIYSISIHSDSQNRLIDLINKLFTIAGIRKLLSGAKSGAWKNTTVREAWLNSLVTIEVLCWFYVGECIGKRHYVGYDV